MTQTEIALKIEPKPCPVCQNPPAHRILEECAGWPTTHILECHRTGDHFRGTSGTSWEAVVDRWNTEVR